MTTRDSLAELYVEKVGNRYSSRTTLNRVTRVESESAFKSGWDALAKLVRDIEMSHGEACISRLGHRESCTCYVATIGKLVGEK